MIFRSLILLCWCVLGGFAAVGPTLTSVNTLNGGVEDQPFIITLTSLAHAANESPTVGITFRIQSVTNGTLTIRNTSPATTPTPIVPGTTILAAGQELLWTPPTNLNGNVAAFTIRAWDGVANSASDVQVTVAVAAVDDPPTLTSIATLANGGDAFGDEDAEIVITRTEVMTRADEADIDTAVVNFRIISVVSGSLGYRNLGSELPPTPVEPGVTILNASRELVWQPPVNANGEVTACTVVATANGLDSSPAVPLKIQIAAVNDLVTVTPNPYAINYSLATSGVAFLLPTTLTVIDPDGQPVLSSGSERLTITGTITNRQGNEDGLEIRNTTECQVTVTGNGTWQIVVRAKPTVKLATASFDATSGQLLVTVDAQAEAHATSGANPPTRTAILGWLLRCIAYTNHAGTFAQSPGTVRQANLVVREAGADVDAAPIRTNITLQNSNQPPAIVRFDQVVCSPTGLGVLNLTVTDGVIPEFDDKTANDELTYSVSVLPNNGRLVDANTGSTVTSFKGSRLNRADPLRASGIAYRNTNPNAGVDRFKLLVRDGGGLSTETEVDVVISFDTGDARIISDPVLVLNQGNDAPVPHTLHLRGPTGREGQLKIAQLTNFTAPGNAVSFSAGGDATTRDIQMDDDGKNNAPVTLYLKTKNLTRDYLAFALVWEFGETNKVIQPFIIRLLPAPSPAVFKASN